MWTRQSGWSFKKENEQATMKILHDDVIKWKHFPRYWPFVQGIHRSLVNYPHKGQWCGALTFSLICAWTHGCANNRDAGDLRRHSAHYDVSVMLCQLFSTADGHIAYLCHDSRSSKFSDSNTDLPSMPWVYLTVNRSMHSIYRIKFAFTREWSCFTTIFPHALSSPNNVY